MKLAKMCLFHMILGTVTLRECGRCIPVDGMNGHRLMGRRRRSTTASGETIPPPQGGRYRPLSDADAVQIADSAFALLESVGLGDLPEKLAPAVLAAGAVRRDDGRITFPRAMVEAALRRSAARVDVRGFAEDRGITVGAANTHIGTAGAAVQILDAETGAFRDSALADLSDMMQPFPDV